MRLATNLIKFAASLDSPYGDSSTYALDGVPIEFDLPYQNRPKGFDFTIPPTEKELADYKELAAQSLYNYFQASEDPDIARIFADAELGLPQTHITKDSTKEEILKAIQEMGDERWFSVSPYTRADLDEMHSNRDYMLNARDDDDEAIHPLISGELKKVDKVKRLTKILDKFRPEWKRDDWRYYMEKLPGTYYQFDDKAQDELWQEYGQIMKESNKLSADRRKSPMRLSTNLQQLMVKQSLDPNTSWQDRHAGLAHQGYHPLLRPLGAGGVLLNKGKPVHTTSRQDMGLQDQYGRYMPFNWGMVSGPEKQDFNRWARRERQRTNTVPPSQGGDVPIAHLIQQSQSRLNAQPNANSLNRDTYADTFMGWESSPWVGRTIDADEVQLEEDLAKAFNRPSGVQADPQSQPDPQPQTLDQATRRLNQASRPLDQSTPSQR